MTAMICLAFMRLAKYKIFAVLVRNVGSSFEQQVFH